MSLEKLNEVATAVASIREALDSGRVAETKEREALAAKQKELETRLTQAEEQMRSKGVNLPGSEQVAKDYSVGRAVRALLTDDWRDAGLELDVHKEAYKRLAPNAQQRVMTTVTPSAGGFLIPEEISTTLIAKLDPVSVCKQAGATVIKPNGWPFKVNKITGGTTAAFAAEGAAPSASDLTLGQISFSPRKISARSVLTLEQVQYGTPQTDGIVMADLQKRLELLQDKWALKGTGASGEALGITGTTGINTVAGASSGKLLYADFAIGIQYLEEDEIVSDKLSCVLHPTQKGELFRNMNSTVSSGTLANEGSAYVFGTPFMTRAKFKELTGIDMFVTSQMTDGTALMGEFSNLWMAEFGGILVGKSTEATDGTYHAFTADLMHVKATRWIDSAVVQAVAFHAITSV